jgi:hypothetical protein
MTEKGCCDQEGSKQPRQEAANLLLDSKQADEEPAGVEAFERIT